ncbi:MAG: rRNA maturation RNase YbeY [Clostridia bacterium]|jgi:probable rRNA maturation factor
MKTRIDIEGLDKTIEQFSVPVTRVMEKILDMHAFDKEDITLSMFIEFTDDDYIQQINKEQRNIDKVTDVLSFPALNCDKGKIIYDRYDIDYENMELFLGDILIAKSKIFSQAESYGHSPLRECVFLASHGLLHLLGYDHQDKESEKHMQKIQEDALKELNYER